MAERSLNLISKILPPDFLFRTRLEIIGLAQDFWKDGRPPVKKLKPNKPLFKSGVLKNVFSSPSKDVSGGDEVRQGRWKADRVRIKEKIWGDGNVVPVYKDLEDSLIKPFGLTKEMTVLDLSAGLGGLARTMALNFRCYVTGLEQDEEIAAIGMEKSVRLGQQKHAEILPFDPETFEPSRHYDCIVMRDLLSRIKDKRRFLKAVVASIKGGGGQFSMTDYVMENGAQNNESVKMWMAGEKGVAPGTHEDVVKVLTNIGLDIRVAEDLTPSYLKEIMRRLGDFVAFLTQYPPESSTKPLVLKEIEFWATRAAAMQQGLKFYRFHAIRY